MGNYILSSHQIQVKKKLIFPKFLSKNLRSESEWTNLKHILESLSPKDEDTLTSLDTCPLHWITTHVDTSGMVPQREAGVFDQKRGSVLGRQKQQTANLRFKRRKWQG